MTAALDIRIDPLSIPANRLKYALLLQRKGRTCREIADSMGLSVHAVEQSLYWDKVRS